jgi:hypothetical protein
MRGDDSASGPSINGPEQIYQPGVAKQDLETEIRNLKFDKERLKKLAEKQRDGFDIG